MVYVNRLLNGLKLYSYGIREQIIKWVEDIFIWYMWTDY